MQLGSSRLEQDQTTILPAFLFLRLLMRVETRKNRLRRAGILVHIGTSLTNYKSAVVAELDVVEELLEQ